MTGDQYKFLNLKTFLVLGLIAAGIAYLAGNTTYIYRSVYIYPNTSNSKLPEFYSKDTVVVYEQDICRFYKHQTSLSKNGLNYIRKEVKVSALKERTIPEVNQILKESFPDHAPRILETRFIKTSKEIRHALGWIVGCLLLGVVVQFVVKVFGSNEK